MKKIKLIATAIVMACLAIFIKPQTNANAAILTFGKEVNSYSNAKINKIYCSNNKYSGKSFQTWINDLRKNPKNRCSTKLVDELQKRNGHKIWVSNDYKRNKVFYFDNLKEALKFTYSNRPYFAKIKVGRDKVTVYVKNNRTFQKGWKTINHHRYYFDKYGQMYQNGKAKIHGHYYYFNSRGYMQRGWKKIGHHWYHFRNNGQLVV